MNHWRKRYRKLINPPTIKGFTPFGRDIGANSSQAVIMFYEEYESIKLCDYEKLTHEQSSVLMNVSRPTFTRIYSSARQKIALALTEGRQLLIEGGKIYFDSDWFGCNNCNSTFSNPNKEETPSSCPLCGSTNIEKSNYADNVQEESNYDTSDYCYCPKCGYKEKHISKKPCKSIICEKCNTELKRINN